MKQEFVNPFLTPAVAVWEEMLGETLELVGAKSIGEGQQTTTDITCVIGVTGSVRGNVLYGFDHQTALNVATRMMDEPIEELDEVSMSALGEIANMITGNAATSLSTAGYECDIAPPVILEPKGVAITSHAKGAEIEVTFKSSLGNLTIRVGLSEALVPAGV